MSMTLEIFGNSTDEAELRATRHGEEMAILKVAIDRFDAQGNKTTPAYVPVLVFGPDSLHVARQVKKGDAIAAKGAMSVPVLSSDGKYVNFSMKVTDADVFSYVSRKPKREVVEANAHLAPEDGPAV